MSDTPRTDAVTRTGRFLDPDKDFVKLAATYSDLLQLARQLERELAEARIHRAHLNYDSATARPPLPTKDCF